MKWARPYLKQLITKGYGSTMDDVVEYLIRREIDDLLRAGVLKPTKEN